MSGPPGGTPSRSGGVELLERALGYTRIALGLVRPPVMSAATPCACWDLATLLAHLDDSLASLEEAGSARTVGLTGPEGPPREVVAALRGRSSALLGLWSRPQVPPEGHGTVLVVDRPLPSAVVAEAGALEVAVHGWDVSWACGAPQPLPESLATDLLVVARELVTDADRPHRFGPARPVPAEAGAASRLLAFLGRDAAAPAARR